MGLVRRSTLETDSSKLSATQRVLASPAAQSLLSGGVAGIVSRSLVAPLERVKLLLQVQSLSAQGATPRHAPRSLGHSLSAIVSQEGVLGLWRGNSANCMRVFPSSALQFFCYGEFKRALYDGRDELAPHERLAAGSLAGAVAQTVTYPLDMIRARLSVDLRNECACTPPDSTLSRPPIAGGCHAAAGARAHLSLTVLAHPTRTDSHGMWAAMRAVVQREGPFALYKGLTPSLVGIMPYVGIDFAVYDTLRRSAWIPRHADSSEPTVAGKLAAGAIAGTAGQTIAYPLDTVRRILQVQDQKVRGGGEKYTGMVDALVGLARRDGVLALYNGLMVNYLKVIPSVSISFLVFETAKEALATRFPAHDPR